MSFLTFFSQFFFASFVDLFISMCTARVFYPSVFPTIHSSIRLFVLSESSASRLKIFILVTFLLFCSSLYLYVFSSNHLTSIYLCICVCIPWFDTAICSVYCSFYSSDWPSILCVYFHSSLYTEFHTEARHLSVSRSSRLFDPLLFFTLLFI